MNATPPLATSSPAQPLEERLQQLEKEAADNLAGWQRARADYQNLKKEWERKQTQFMTDAKEMLLEDMLPIYGRLRQALAREPQESSPWLVGVNHFIVQMDKLFEQWQVECINPALGTPFDPSRQEALRSEFGGEFVTEVLEFGYAIDGRVLYPARVAVGQQADFVDDVGISHSSIDLDKPPDNGDV